METTFAPFPPSLEEPFEEPAPEVPEVPEATNGKLESSGEAEGEAERKKQRKFLSRHKALAQWLLANPMATHVQAARALGMSTGWVSQIVNSDAFRHYLEGMEEDVVADVVIPLRNRLLDVAERSVTRLGLFVETTQDPKFLLDVADKSLHRLGYAPTRGPEPPSSHNVTVNQNLYVTDSQALAEARARLTERTLPPLLSNRIGNGIVDDSKDEV